MALRKAETQNAYKVGSRVYRVSERKQQIQYQIPEKQTGTFNYEVDKNINKIGISSQLQRNKQIMVDSRNQHSLTKYIDTITQRYNSSDRVNVRTPDARNLQLNIKLSKHKPQTQIQQSAYVKTVQNKYRQKQVNNSDYQTEKKANGNQRIKIIGRQPNKYPQYQNLQQNSHKLVNSPQNYNQINQKAKPQQNPIRDNIFQHRKVYQSNMRNNNQYNVLQTQIKQTTSSKTINLNELDIESQCNSSNIGKGSSKQRGGSFRHLQSHSNTSQVFKNILLQSHHLSTQSKVSERKVVVFVYLREIFLRRTRYSFQLIRQFYDFGEQEQSQVSSMDQYTWLMYNDQKFHTLCKIYQTKLLQEKLWAFLNLKYWQLFKNMHKFTIRVQTVTRKIQDRVKKLHKKDSFKAIFEYAAQIANKKSETKASQPTTPVPIVRTIQTKQKDKIVIDTSKDMSKSGIYTTYVTTSTRRLTYEQYLKERQERERSRKKQQNSLSNIKQQPDANLSERKSTITYMSRNNNSVLSDENKRSKVLISNQNQASSGVTYVSNQTKVEVTGRANQSGKIKTVINTQKYAQNIDTNNRSPYVIPYRESLDQRKSIIDGYLVSPYAREQVKVRKVASNSILNRYQQNSDRYKNQNQRNANIYRSRESLERISHNKSIQKRQVQRQTKYDGAYNQSRYSNHRSNCCDCECRCHVQKLHDSRSSEKVVRQQHHYYYYGAAPILVSRNEHQRLTNSGQMRLDDSRQRSVNRSYHYYCNHKSSPNRHQSIHKDSHVQKQDRSRNYVKSGAILYTPIQQANNSKVKASPINVRQGQAAYRSKQFNQHTQATKKNLNQSPANRLNSHQSYANRSLKNIYQQKNILISPIAVQQAALKEQLKLQFITNQQCTVCKESQQIDQSQRNSSVSKKLKRQKNRMNSRRKELSESRTDRSNRSDHSTKKQKGYCKHGKRIKKNAQPEQSTVRAYYTINRNQISQNQRSDRVIPKQFDRYDIQQRIMYMRQLQNKNIKKQTKPFQIS